jgi:hypothetical protein
MTEQDLNTLAKVRGELERLTGLDGKTGAEWWYVCSTRGALVKLHARIPEQSEPAATDHWTERRRADLVDDTLEAVGIGDYTGDECPRCGRVRIMSDGRFRKCEKCEAIWNGASWPEPAATGGDEALRRRAIDALTLLRFDGQPRVSFPEAEEWATAVVDGRQPAPVPAVTGGVKELRVSREQLTRFAGSTGSRVELAESWVEERRENEAARRDAQPPTASRGGGEPSEPLTDSAHHDAELRDDLDALSRAGGEPDERRADEAFPDAYALMGPGYDREVAPAFSNEARVVNVYTACLALHRALENGRELGRIAAERQAYIDRMTPLWSKSQPPTDGLRERVEAVIYDIEGTFEAALATPSPAMRALLDRLRAALAATQPEAPDAEVGS